MTTIQDKKTSIKNSLNETRLLRENQYCYVRELKIDQSHLNNKQLQHLNRMFLESKWLYNSIIQFHSEFTISKLNQYDTKIKSVLVKNKDGIYESRNIDNLSSQIKQGIYETFKMSLSSLKSLKQKGKKVGKLKFKSEYNSIYLKQYGNTHKIKNKDGKLSFHIVGFNKPIKVHGLEQIKDLLHTENLNNKNIASAKLIKKPNGFYIHLVCFKSKPNLNNNNDIPIKQPVGLDFGIKTSITTSDGEKFNIMIEETRSIKRASRRVNKSQKGSNNRKKRRLKLQVAYEKLTNRKKDLVNKIVSKLSNNYSVISIQDENIKGWHHGWFGKQVQHSSLGKLKARLKNLSNNQCHIVPRFYPTTKLCPNCGNISSTISLSDRIYSCDCGYSFDRDIHAARNILNHYVSSLCTERTLTCGEMATSGGLNLFNSLSAIVEPRSQSL